jgi:hypothetical protein
MAMQLMIFDEEERVMSRTISTAIIKLSNVFAGLLSAGGMGLWHGVEYYEKEKIVGEEYYQQWSNVSSKPMVNNGESHACRPRRKKKFLSRHESVTHFRS